jgi:hypothetical protein
MNALIAYLTENSCRGRAEECLPAKTEETRKLRRPHKLAEPV